MLRGSCFIQLEEYPAMLWLPWGHSLWLPGLYVPAKLSRDRDAVKEPPPLEKLGLEESPGSEASPSESMEGPGKELSDN